MFGNNPKADFEVHKHFTKEDFKTIEVSKDVCTPGYAYKDVFGRQTVFGSSGPSIGTDFSDITKRVTEEVLRQLKQ
jgi:hypothetical protein